MNQQELKFSSLQSFEPQDWMSRAIDRSCSDSSWGNLVNEIYSSVKNRLAQLEYTNFSQLSQQEQAVLIEKELSLMGGSQSKDNTLHRFSNKLGEDIDRELVRYINYYAPREKEKDGVDKKHASNVEVLVNACSKEIVGLLESSPLEMASTAKLFLNRSLPDSLRPHIWTSALSLSTEKLSMISFHRLPASLDVQLARRCYGCLERHFPEFSSRSNTTIIKNILANISRKFEITISANETSLENLDKFVYLIIPLLITLEVHIAKSKNTSATSDADPHSSTSITVEKRKPIEKDFVLPSSINKNNTSNNNVNPEVNEQGIKAAFHEWRDEENTEKLVERALTIMLEPRFLGLLVPENSIASIKISSSPRMSTLPKPNINTSANSRISFAQAAPASVASSHMNPPLDAQAPISSSSSSKALKYRISPAFSQMIHKTMSILEEKNDEYYIFLFNLRQDTIHAINRSFQTFIDEHLKSAFAGLLQLTTTYFVWDQGFIAGFQEVLPVIAAAIILGAREELQSLITLGNVIESFCVFANNLTVFYLQKLLTEHCSDEIMELFDVPGNYTMQPNEQTGILQAVYKKLLWPEDNAARKWPK